MRKFCSLLVLFAACSLSALSQNDHPTENTTPTLARRHVHAADGALTADNAVEVEPGVFLPSRGMIYAFMPKADHPLARIEASELTLNRHSGKNFAKSFFYVGSRQTLDIAGPTAKTVVQPTVSSFFVRLSADEPSLAMSRITLVKLEPVAGARIVGALDANVFGGGAKRKVQRIDVSKKALSDEQWAEITPIQNLAPGEYAIVFFPKDPKLFASSVYDFRVAND